MYLKKLSANFDMHEISFNLIGLSIILGQSTSHDHSQTTNGAGKTLSLRIIDFCLGADISRKGKMKDEFKRLKNWEFYLQTESDKNPYLIKRIVDEPRDIFINDDDYSLSDFSKTIYQKYFIVQNNISGISFRSLISRFLRNDAFEEWYKCKKNEQLEVSYLNSGYLLGLDAELLNNKIIRKKSVIDFKNNKKSLENDDDLKEVLKSSEIGVNITTLKADIKRIEREISEFRISENYSKIEQDIEDLKREKQELSNDVFKCEKLITGINKSLDMELDVSLDQVKTLYESANVILGENIQKKLSEVEGFHVKLLSKRKERLQSDKAEYEKQVIDQNKRLKIIDNSLNRYLEVLQTSGTLSEYESLIKNLNDLENRLSKMNTYNDLLKEMSTKIIKVQAEISDGNKEANDYINEIEPYIRELSTKFKSFVDFIYGESRESGIEISVNTRDNKLQFNIEPQIVGESSEGIGNVKIFCMDLLILALQKNHSIKFIYHDSTLFNGIDPRQQFKMLELAKKICEENNLQYIVNLNSDTFEKIKEKVDNSIELKVDERAALNQYFEDCVVVRLLDNSPENRLLKENLD